MIVPSGQYRYQIRRDGIVVAREETIYENGRITGTRESLDGSSRNEVAAEISEEGIVLRVNLRYARGPFSRNANYEARDEFLRGSVSALGGRNALTAKLGRFREVDADFVLFRALTIAHVRARSQTRWTGRVASIDSATLVVSSNKQSARSLDASGLRWSYEARMGDVEEIQTDSEGRILHRRDSRGGEAILTTI
jgi:hypothetical protein